MEVSVVFVKSKLVMVTRKEARNSKRIKDKSM